MKQNNWQKKFGASRRALDRKLLEECERNLPDMPLESPQMAQDGRREFPAPKTAARLADEAREAIARAFGRPLR